jgi:pSer/pThr/pTyr-binding forkhead associated (FHA) protein
MHSLLLMQGSHSTKQIALLSNTTTLGRASGNHVVLDSMEVSRRHAVVVATGSFVTINDMQSRNGVFVNGVRVRSQVLAGGDEIAIGPFRIRFLSRGHDASAAEAWSLEPVRQGPGLLSDSERNRPTSPAHMGPERETGGRRKLG